MKKDIHAAIATHTQNVGDQALVQLISTTFRFI